MARGSDKALTHENTVVFGFGAQGRAQALNLRDAGVPVSVCIRVESPRRRDVEEAGIPLTFDPAEAASKASRAVVLIPDSDQPRFYREALHEALPPGAAMVFAHGYSIHYGRITPRHDIDVMLAAPLGHGDAVRSGFERKSGVPFVVAVHQDATGAAWARARDYASTVGGGSKLIESTFQEEVETDLFVEQALLCGGVPELVRMAFDTLLDGGYNPDIAYFCCLSELKPIVDIMVRESIAGMRGRISDTARFGSATRGPSIIGQPVREMMDRALREIRSGEFARELAADEERGFTRLRSSEQRDASHPIEELHRRHSEDES